jgi:hypothetical protein
MWNFAMKFVLDQTVAGVVNIVLFIVLINMLKGINWGRIWELTCEVSLTFFWSLYQRSSGRLLMKVGFRSDHGCST